VDTLAWRSRFNGPETGNDPLDRETALFLIKKCEDQNPGLPPTGPLHRVKNPDRTFGRYH
jgi:hypothetical protein